MDRKKLTDAQNEISDTHIAKAAVSKKWKIRYWLGAVAGILAIVLLLTALGSPITAMASGLVAAPTYPKMAPYSGTDERAFERWRESQRAQYDQPEGYANGTEGFFRRSIAEFLAGSGEENAVCSPVNLYMALAMLAETAGGQTQQQIFDLLGADSIEALRIQAGHVWNAHYCDDGATTLTLANSLWLADWLSYDRNTAGLLAENYYASVYHGILGSERMQRSFQDWLNTNTGGLLKEQVQGLRLDNSTALALASTIYYCSKWDSTFSAAWNTEDIFHTPTGDVPATYMNKTLLYNNYYWGEDFGAVYNLFEDGSKMWLILPDEGLTPADILASGHAVELALTQRQALMAYENQRNLKINLQLPKFDVVSDIDLKDGLQNLGIIDAFDEELADFSAISPRDSLYLNQAKHAARVTADEDGVIATAYTVMALAGAAAPSEDAEEIDFTLDRPFLFIITSRDDLPLFAGIVNQP